jgi:hypothetical protein
MATASKRRRSARGLAAAALVALSSLAFASSASAEGNFVIGDGNAAVGAPVTFWGAQWWKLNSLSGGSAPPAFKGWANTVGGQPACGGTWTTDPGNSSDPPAAPLAPVIEVIVTSSVKKSGRVISGDTTAVALVATDPGYAPNPGHAGTGTVVGFVCKAGEEGGLPG